MIVFLQAPRHHFETHQSLKIFFSAGYKRSSDYSSSTYDGPPPPPIYQQGINMYDCGSVLLAPHHHFETPQSLKIFFFCRLLTTFC